MALINFNSAQVEPQASFEPIPNDWYNVIMDQSEMKPTKAGTGAYLECRLSVVDGSYANRKLFIRLNIQNDNTTAVEIAYAQLSAICHAVNVVQVNDSQELHGKPFMAKVVVRPPQGDYEASNECKAFKACDGSAGAAPSASAPSGQASGATPAWAAKKKEEPTPEVKKEVVKKEVVIEDDTDDDDAEMAAMEAAIAAKKAAKAEKAAKKAALQAQLAEAEAEEADTEKADPAGAVVEKTPEVVTDGDAEEKPPWMRG